MDTPLTIEALEALLKRTKCVHDMLQVFFLGKVNRKNAESYNRSISNLRENFSPMFDEASERLSSNPGAYQKALKATLAKGMKYLTQACESLEELGKIRTLCIVLGIDILVLQDFLHKKTSKTKSFDSSKLQAQGKTSNWTCFYVTKPMVFGGTEIMTNLSEYMQELATEATHAEDWITGIENWLHDYKEAIADWNLNPYICDTYLISLPSLYAYHPIGFAITDDLGRLLIKNQYAGLMRIWLKVDGNEFTEAELPNEAKTGEQ